MGGELVFVPAFQICAVLNQNSHNVLVTGFVWTFTYLGAPVTLSSSVASFRFDEPGDYVVTLTVSDAAGSTHTDTVIVTVVRDTTPPPVPSGLVLQPGAADCLGLTWAPSVADDLAGYAVYRYNVTSERFEAVGNLTSDTIAFHDCDLSPGVQYLYWVVSFDVNGTRSAPSAIIGGKVPLPSTTATPPEPLPYLTIGGILVLGALLVFAVGRRRKPGREEPPSTPHSETPPSEERFTPPPE